MYRNIGDIEKLISYSALDDVRGTCGMVIGGGLLGLEAAKAMLDLEKYGKIAVVDQNKWVLARQLDADAGGLVTEMIRDLGVELWAERKVGRILTEPEEGGVERVVGVEFDGGARVETSSICFAVSSSVLGVVEGSVDSLNEVDWHKTARRAGSQFGDRLFRARRDISRRQVSSKPIFRYQSQMLTQLPVDCKPPSQTSTP